MASGDRNYDIATETTQQEMLSMLSSGASEGFSNLVYGEVEVANSSKETPIIINGKGKITFWSKGNAVGYLYVTIDSVENYTTEITIPVNGNLTIEFNSVVKFYNTHGASYLTYYLAQYK